MEDQDFANARRRRQIRRRFFQRHHLIFFLIILLLLVGILITFIRISSNNIVSLIFTALAALLTAAAWLFPGISTAFIHRSSLDPPAEPSRPVRSQKIVQEIYDHLIDPDCSAIMFLGLNGIGATSLAKQVYTYVENRRARFFFKRTKRPSTSSGRGARGEGSFFKRVLWVGLDEESTLSGLARKLGLPDVSRLPYDRQADQLLKYLDTAKRRWLIVLDFKNPLSRQTRDALADRPGFSEFLHLLNSRACESRFLLTSRAWSSESYSDPALYMQEYALDGFEDKEGRALLQQCRVEGTVGEQLWAIGFCEGHAGALRILPKVLAGPPAIELSSVIRNADDQRSWMREITREYLDHIYQALSDVEREMLFAFSIYRRPVQLKAVQAVMDDQFNARRDELREALRKLIRRYFFLNSGGDSYQLHPLVAMYAQQHFADPNNPTQLQKAHRRAAEYYEKDARGHIGIGLQHRRAQLYIEALYHLLEAGEDSEAYSLMQREMLLRDLLSL